MSFDIVWCAWRGGFASTWARLDNEFSPFKAVTAFSARLLETLPLVANRFHLARSAGGLFEGLLNVGPGALPAPVSPYGELEQEQQLRALPRPLVKRIKDELCVAEESAGPDCHNHQQRHARAGDEYRCGRTDFAGLGTGRQNRGLHGA